MLQEEVLEARRDKMYEDIGQDVSPFVSFIYEHHLWIGGGEHHLWIGGGILLIIILLILAIPIVLVRKAFNKENTTEQRVKAGIGAAIWFLIIGWFVKESLEDPLPERRVVMRKTIYRRRR